MASLIQLAKDFLDDKKKQVLFTWTAFILTGYDHGMMSLINTNRDYLHSMGVDPKSSYVGVIVAVYYVGCSVGADLFSRYADKQGRKNGIFYCIATASVGNLIMFLAGIGGVGGAVASMLLGRIVMGLGVGGVDSVVSVYTSELTDNGATKSEAQARRSLMNTLGLNIAFAVNLGVTRALGKDSQWAWRIPIIVMQAYPLLLLLILKGLPESPTWFIRKDLVTEATDALQGIVGEESSRRVQELLGIHQQEQANPVGYKDMLKPQGAHFHPTIITVMVQINQALTGYGALAVYGPQMIELLGFSKKHAEYLTQANFILFFLLMMFAKRLMDSFGRRPLMINTSIALTACFSLLTLFSGLTLSADQLRAQQVAPSVLGTVSLFVASGAFSIGWLPTVWLVPTEIQSPAAQAQAAVISVVVWGIANFGITILSPLMFNNLYHWMFLIFAASNALGGLLTLLYLPESGGRNLEEIQRFFDDAKDEGTWRVGLVASGAYKRVPRGETGEEAERAPLLRRPEE